MSDNVEISFIREDLFDGYRLWCVLKINGIAEFESHTLDVIDGKITKRTVSQLNKLLRCITRNLLNMRIKRGC